jgi:tetratricopeptide (TPR) repeat protein
VNPRVRLPTRPPFGARALVAMLLLAAPAVGAGQEGGPDEVGMMRQVTLLEAAGDLAGAEQVLVSILELRPASAPALLALERVLLQQRRVDELPPRVERGLRDEPRSALLNQLLLRTYSRLDRADALEAAAAAWVAAAPGIESPYRFIARTWEARGDYGRARAALEEGRRRVAAADALAFELGALYAALGDHRLAAAEWDRAIGRDGRGLNQVRRGLRAMPDGGAAVIPELVDRLTREPATRERLTAGVELAVGAGLESSATLLAAPAAAMHTGKARGTFLLDLARRADGSGLSRLAYWAYGELVSDGDVGMLEAVRGRFAELALALGESDAAVAGVDVARGSDGSGSGEGRRAEALRIEVLAGQDPASARQALRSFREAYRDAPELDVLAATVAEAVLSSEDRDQAERVLVGVRGPRSALLRGRLALGRGDRDEARTAFLAAAPALTGAEATRTLALVTLLDRTSSDGAILLGLALDGAWHGDPGSGLDRLVAGSSGLPAAEQAALLEFAAALADDGGLTEDARRLRRTLVADHPRSSEAPAALLALARSIRSEADGEARELLERLIIEYPRSALVPQARRELEQIRRGAAAMNHDPGR